MAYTELLEKKEWKQKCSEILNRDKFTCQDCGSIGYHNDTFVTLYNVKLVDFIFPKSLFFDNTFNYLLKELEDNAVFKRDYFKIKINQEISNLNIYSPYAEFNELNSFNWPCGIKIISDKILSDNYPFNYYIHNKITKIGKYNVKHNIIFVAFDNIITNKCHVLVTKETPYYIQNQGSIKYNVINIIFEKFLIYIQTPIQMSGLNIHHKYYIYNHSPWEYENDALITLCENCHKNRHEKSKIPIYNSNKEFIGYTTICPKCGGSGYLSQYSHIEHGICFNCGGEGVILNENL